MKKILHHILFLLLFCSIAFNYNTRFTKAEDKKTQAEASMDTVSSTEAAPVSESISTLKKLEKSTFGMGHVDRKNTRCRFTATKTSSASGYQLKVYKGSKCLKTFIMENKSTTGYFTYKKNQVYRYRVRQYVTDPLTGSKQYGAWSAYRYFMVPEVGKSVSAKYIGTDLTLNRVSKVKKYVMYVSPQKEKGFQKTWTLTPKKEKAIVHMHKIGRQAMKSKATYYIRVVPMIQVGDKTVKSDIVTTVKATTKADYKKVSLKKSWKYADYSAISSGTSTLYLATGANAKGITVCVNAGHGTKGGDQHSTYSHPDKTPKYTDGTNAAGAVTSMAISSGTEMLDGTPEAKVTLKLAMIVKTDLLKAGYNVLMVRESDDVQLDNIARTVMANNLADCHIALHYDSTTTNKGAFYIAVPDIKAYKNMEPVKSHWRSHNKLGARLIAGMREKGVKIYGPEKIELDLTQTSYSTIPSVDLEIGDKASDYSKNSLEKISAGIVKGIKSFWK